MIDCSIPAKNPMKSVKILGLIVGGLVVLLLIRAFLVSLLVNPNDNRTQS